MPVTHSAFKSVDNVNSWALLLPKRLIQEAPMAKTASAIRFEESEKEWITAFAKMNGSTFSAQVRQWTLERLEDELDARDLRDAINSASSQRTSWADTKAELGI
jgi:uncharacterized protein YdaU (DUF1376 family)